MSNRLNNLIINWDDIHINESEICDFKNLEMSKLDVFEIINRINNGNREDVTQKDVMLAIMLITQEQNNKQEKTNELLQLTMDKLEGVIKKQDKDHVNHERRINELENYNEITKAKLSTIQQIFIYGGGSVSFLLSVLKIVEIFT